MQLITKIVVVLLMGLLLTGCSTHMMPISYAPTYSIDDSGYEDKAITVGVVQDSRGTASNWLGAIRGGYGNVLKSLYTERDTNAVVKETLEAALKARGALPDSATSRFSLDINLTKLDASYYFNKEAHTHFTLTLKNAARETLFSQTYVTDVEQAGVGAGIFGDVDALAAFANEALNKNIDKALDDPDLISAIQASPASPGPRSDAGQSAEARLTQLDGLKESGLISAEEYRAKRQAIIDEL
jgi:uncharacterized lipoprotein YajG